ncbi:hypothetical protein J7M23_10200 [Candidatus Sumerlaeota bacterium]|nr:hypothetical protein [Candidatus Sumerlaeota bacterium]
MIMLDFICLKFVLTSPGAFEKNLCFVLVSGTRLIGYDVVIHPQTWYNFNEQKIISYITYK